MANAIPNRRGRERLPTRAHPRYSGFPFTTLEDNRLSTGFANRCIIGSAAAFLGGLSLGVTHGSKTAGLRFRAENSHRFPTTPTGWYFYHKSKNYNCMLAGVKDGLKLGLRIPIWAVCFFYVEEAVDDLRDTRDFGSTVVAGLTVSCIFSIKNGFNAPTTVRTSRAGLYTGLVYGLLQDAIALARGRRLGYLDYLKSTWKSDAALE